MAVLPIQYSGRNPRALVASSRKTLTRLGQNTRPSLLKPSTSRHVLSANRRHYDALRIARHGPYWRRGQELQLHLASMTRSSLDSFAFFSLPSPYNSYSAVSFVARTHTHTHAHCCTRMSVFDQHRPLSTCIDQSLCHSHARPTPYPPLPPFSQLSQVTWPSTHQGTRERNPLSHGMT